MRTRLEFKWELISHYGDEDFSGCSTARAQVMGGWLVRVVAWNRKDKCQSESMTFVPDHNHQWCITPPIEETPAPVKTLANDFKAAPKG